MINLSSIFGAIVGLVVAGSALMLYNDWIENPMVRRNERVVVLAEARAAALALIAKRSEDNEEISDLDAAGLCAELGGRWVPNEDRCD